MIAAKLLATLLVLLVLWLPAGHVLAAPPATAPAHPSGLALSSDDFPIAVWLQPPALAERYKAAGINLYVGLWEGPTQAQLAALGRAGMPIICDQNKIALAHLDDKIILGWMHGDEPDNAQSLGAGKGYGPPITPEKVQADYRAMRAKDPTRPVMLNLGQAVAWDGWIGRGVRSGHPEDYPRYLEGCDIASFDIYPVVHDNPQVAGKLWYVARGVDRLRQWSDGRKPVFACIECTHIQSDRIPTPPQVKSEVWMALVHGANGVIYFVHEWKPKFNEHALLDNPPMLAAVTALNRQIHELAPVLNSPTPKDQISVVTKPADVPVDVLLKRDQGATYVFAVAMRGTAVHASIALPAGAGAKAEVLGESRQLPVSAGRLEDDFQPWQVHLYRIP